MSKKSNATIPRKRTFQEMTNLQETEITTKKVNDTEPPTKKMKYNYAEPTESEENAIDELCSEYEALLDEITNILKQIEKRVENTFKIIHKVNKIIAHCGKKEEDNEDFDLEINE